jgi:hypothetical protein
VTPEQRKRLLHSLSTIATERHAISHAITVLRSELSTLRTRAPEASPEHSLEIHEQVIACQHLLNVADVTWNTVSNYIHNFTFEFETNLPSENKS